MTIKITVNLDHAALAKIAAAQETAAAKTLDAFKTEIQEAAVVPKDIGDLEESITSDYEIAGRKVIAWLGWNTPYARKLFYHPEYNFRQDKNENAQGRWTDQWVVGENQDFLSNTFVDFMKEDSGGLIK